MRHEIYKDGKGLTINPDKNDLRTFGNFGHFYDKVLYMAWLNNAQDNRGLSVYGLYEKNGKTFIMQFNNRKQSYTAYSNKEGTYDDFRSLMKEDDKYYTEKFFANAFSELEYQAMNSAIEPNPNAVKPKKPKI